MRLMLRYRVYPWSLTLTPWIPSIGLVFSLRFWVRLPCVWAASRWRCEDSGIQLINMPGSSQFNRLVPDWVGLVWCGWGERAEVHSWSALIGGNPQKWCCTDLCWTAVPSMLCCSSWSQIKLYWHIGWTHWGPASSEKQLANQRAGCGFLCGLIIHSAEAYLVSMVTASAADMELMLIYLG